MKIEIMEKRTYTIDGFADPADVRQIIAERDWERLDEILECVEGHGTMTVETLSATEVVKRKAATKKAKATTSSPDAWTSLVLRTMSVAELKRESVNRSNSPAERQAMVNELATRKAVRR